MRQRELPAIQRVDTRIDIPRRHRNTLPLTVKAHLRGDKRQAVDAARLGGVRKHGACTRPYGNGFLGLQCGRGPGQHGLKIHHRNSHDAFAIG